METETTTQAGATKALAWLVPARFAAWCVMCAELTDSDSATDTRWCAKCGTRREQ